MTRVRRMHRQERPPAPEPASDANHAASEPSRDAIARRAYELYLARGGADGREIDDWLQAERELRSGKAAIPSVEKPGQGDGSFDPNQHLESAVAGRPSPRSRASNRRRP